jgi:DNA-binding NarL/FixJ family response regulator
MQTSPATPAPLRVAVLNDYELVVRGLASMLEPYADRVTVVELDSNLPAGQPVDVGLYDTFALPSPVEDHLDEVGGDPNVHHRVLYLWTVTPEVLEAAQRHGFTAVLPKSLGAEDLVRSLERVHAGERIFDPFTTEEDEGHDGGWPGKAEGLTPRQSEIIALITEGLSNQEIARRAYLSINSVKSYIRAAYRTMGVTSRSQAVIWGIDHGFQRDHRRITEGEGVPGRLP